MNCFEKILAVIGALFVITVVLDDDNSNLKNEAINHGYATYCLTTGEFAWVGECEGAGMEAIN